MITRKIGKLLRGKATPTQIFMAALLGSWLGFVPGFGQAPGLVIVLALLLLVLNANLGIALACAALAKLVSLALVRVSFEVGYFLLDGPTQPIFVKLINAPGTAWFGLEHYVTTGGLALGTVFGLAMGFAVTTALQRFRHKMASLQEGSERYQQFVGKGWVKFLVFVFVGGGSKKTYAELAQKKVGNPIRIAGVVVAAVVVAGLFLLQKTLSEPVLTAAIKNQLESANGATVDLDGVDLDLGEGKLAIRGLAAADPNALDKDILRAANVEADVAGADLWRKRLALDRVVVRDVQSGVQRDRPGERIGETPAPAEPPPAEPGEKTIDDYIKQAEVWKERLARVREWLDKLGQSEPVGEDGLPVENDESLRERLAREAAMLGYANVVASHLLTDAPAFLVRELVVDGLSTTQLPGEVFDVNGANLSSQPYLVEQPTTLSARSRSGNISLDTGLDAQSQDPSANKLAFSWKGLQTDSVTKDLQFGGTQPIHGGTMDISLDGHWGSAVGFIDLPLSVVMHDVTLDAGGKERTVDEIALPIGLRGPIDAPRIRVDEKAWRDALVKAGAAEATQELRDKAESLIEEHGGEDIKEKASGLLDGFMNKKKKDDSE